MVHGGLEDAADEPFGLCEIVLPLSLQSRRRGGVGNGGGALGPGMERHQLGGHLAQPPVDVPACTHQRRQPALVGQARITTM